MISMEYLAGFFDGEGCVLLSWHRRDRRWCPQVTIELKRDIRNMKLLSRFCCHYGVRLNIAQSTCRWALNRKETIQRFINDVLPYTTIKTTQLILLKTYLEEGTYGYRISQQLKSHKRRE